MHKSKLMQKFYYQEGVTVLDLPARSPDLCPIEIVGQWSPVKNYVTKKRPKTLRELKIHLSEAWKEKITPDQCQKLYESMGKRMDLVIQNDRGRIPY